jgi:hypothetical protein
VKKYKGLVNKMKKYAYNELHVKDPVIMPEDEIVALHQKRFNERLLALKLDPNLYTKDDCIDDWVTENWAWEYKGEN